MNKQPQVARVRDDLIFFFLRLSFHWIYV